jgi:hypothetical protein
MNLMPAKIGAEPKKVAAVVVLFAVAGYFYVSNRNSGGSDASSPSIVSTRPSSAPSVAVGQKAAPRQLSRSGRNGTGNNPREFRPSMKPPKGVEPSSVDPTLHLNALVRLQDVKLESTTRSLFEISAAPPTAVNDKGVGPIKPAEPPFVLYGPKPPPPDPPKPPTPRAPAIPLKFYGFVNPARPDVKRAFFLDNDEIMVAGEGDVIKKHYKILRIGINSAEVEDIQFKGDNTKQTLPLETELQG